MCLARSLDREVAKDDCEIKKHCVLNGDIAVGIAISCTLYKIYYFFHAPHAPGD